MDYTYRCYGNEDMKPRTWKGRIAEISATDTIEAIVNTRGSHFHIIVGRHSYGNFICIPNLGIGTELAAPDDRFWNCERLQMEYPWLSDVDAISITDAVKELGKHYEF